MNKKMNKEKTLNESIKAQLDLREAKNKEYMLDLSDSNALSGFTAKNLSEGQKAEKVALTKLRLEAKHKGVTKEHLFRAEVKALNKAEKTKLKLI